MQQENRIAFSGISAILVLAFEGSGVVPWWREMCVLRCSLAVVMYLQSARGQAIDGAFCCGRARYDLRGPPLDCQDVLAARNGARKRG